MRFPYLLLALSLSFGACGSGNDSDGDGLSNSREERLGTDPNDPDSDGDGLEDGPEVREFNTDPLDIDSDADGLSDGDEVNVHGSDPNAEDTDEDGLTDLAEVRDTDSDPTLADTDGDGLTDPQEMSVGSLPRDPDSDSDGLSDPLEVERGTNPRRADTDEDGLTDFAEAFEHRTDPLLADTDGDGLDDGPEVNEFRTNPLFEDTDFDGLGDGAEAAHGSSPLSADTDFDGLRDADEVSARTDPTLSDTDSDGLSDGDEGSFGTDPLNPDTDNDGAQDGEEVDAAGDPLTDDADEDGLSDFEEIRVFESAPAVADTDADGINDGVEVGFRMDPVDPADGAADLDEDGVISRDEIAAGTHPRVADTDGDGLNDGDEAEAGTDPLSPDSDEDGINDGAEVRVGANPLLADSDADGIDDGAELRGPEDIDGDGLVNIVDIDSDGDGWPDADELRAAEDTDGDGPPTFVDADADNDGLRDGIEIDLGLDPFDPADAELDTDGDGLTVREEVERQTRPDLADTDGDGIEDGDELTHGLDPNSGADAALDADNDTLSNLAEITLFGTDPNSDDTDGDGLLDDRELAFGANPLNIDTDDDGVLDGAEPTAGIDIDGDGDVGVLDTDSDEDGISDGDEVALGLGDDVVVGSGDSDGDGIGDAAELAAGTDPTSQDTDGDGLTDAAELAGCTVRIGVVTTNPLVADTDADGLSDAIECALGTSPVAADADGDGASDGEELVPCAGEADCGPTGFRTASDPFDPDTDDDGVPDGFDPNRFEPDADGDGLLDAEELVEGFSARTARFDPPAGADFVPPPQTLAVPFAGAPWHLIAAEVVVTDEPLVGEVRTEAPPTVTMTALGESTEHALRWEGARWISSRPVRANEADVNVSFAGTGFRVLRVVLMCQRGTTLGAPAAGLRTFADEVDSDGDGLEDGEETPGFWLEAEHFAVGDPARLVEAGASNGVAIEATAGAPLFSLGVGDWGFESNQFYSVFVRARRTDDFVLETTPQVSAQGSSSIACDSVDSDICGFGSCVFDEGDGEFSCDTSPTGAPRTAFAVEADYEWRFAGAYRVDDTIERFPIVIREGADSAARWAIDRVAILPRLFQEEEVVQSYDELGVVQSARVLGVGGSVPLTFRAEVPWGLSDPMEADTDGDGVREMDGAIAGSVGWLTDGTERALRLNPFDRDSDLDARFGSPDGDAVDDFTTIGLSGGVALPAGGPDGRADYGDDTDPSPRPLDRDRDGVTDGVEDLAQLAALQEACFVANSCTGPCAACPDTDYDDETDLAGICGAGLDPCWSDDDDRDDDGLTDGQEDGNRNGRQDFGETNPDSADSDGDCIPDGVEAGLACPQGTGTVFRTGANTAGCTGPFTFGPIGFEPAPSSGVRTSPTQTDSDGDGLSDGDGSDGMGVGGVGPGSGEDQNCNGQQDAGETDASRSDTDSDLLSDGDEVTGPTNPLVFDTDDDGLGDGEEVLQYLTNPLLEDTDMDRLTDSEEVRPPEGTPATDPTDDDTDGDGLEDGEELLGDGALAVCEWEEVCGTTGDCLSAAPCTFGPTNPTRVDTDGDGDTDGAEVSVTGPSNPRRTNPNRADTDGDGISDRDERLGTGPLAPFGPGNPIDSDSDGDGFLDLTEIENGSDPTNGTSLPSTLELSPGGVVIDGATFAPTPTGLVATGRVPLSCGGRAATAFVDGSVELIREGGGYRVVASGDFIVPGAGAREETLWTGEAILAGDQRSFEPGATTARLSELTLAGGGFALNLDPPSCTVDADCPSGAEGSCQLGTCEGVNGADGFQVCAGEIIDRAATINLPAPTEDPMMSAAGPRDSDVRYLSDFTRVRLPTERLLTPMMRQVSGHDPGMFPWEGRTCFRDPNPVRISASMFGDFNFSPNPNVPIGSVPPPGEPAFNFGGVGGLNLPDVGPVDIMPSVADVDFDIPTGQFDFGTSFPFGVPLGDFGGLPGGPGAFVQTANLRVPEGNRCRWDAGRGMYSCEFEYTRQSRPAGGGPRVRQF
ncbi:MAG: hypothetical protein AAF938_01825, partial [Myxococcota bacterium]